MAFKSLFIAHAPDADPAIHRCSITTGMAHFSAVLIKNQAQALEVCREFVREQQIDSIILCPGFTHGDIADIVRSVGPAVAVCPSRSDGPGSRIALEALRRAGWFQPPTKI